MFGLEGSGFTIAVGLILLLSGVVMFYCRKKIVQCEHKVDSMFSLVSALHEELEALKAAKFNEVHIDNETTSFSAHPYQELIPVDIDDDNADINDSSESESDTDSDNEDDENNSHYDDVKVVDLGQIEELSLDVDDQIDENNLADNLNLISVDVVESEGTEIEEEDDESDESDEGNEALAETDTDAMNKTETQSEVVKLIKTNVDMDYSKMQVSALKKIVSERNLATGVAKLRKQELIDILQQN